MIAQAYFQLVDVIDATNTDEGLDIVRARLAATAMHPFERRALERRLQSREEALLLDLEL
jgi:hypothetical protein